MASSMHTLSPAPFALDSFLAILPERAPMTGEDPGSYSAFHAAMAAALEPASPYEQVIAENLIGLEWELLQQRRMREASLRRITRQAICKAVVTSRRAAHIAKLAKDVKAHKEAGGDSETFEAEPFDEEAAKAAGEHLAARAASANPDKQAGAHEEIAALGMDPVDLMGEAYRSWERSVTVHNEAIVALERRRREVRRDFNALQRKRPAAPAEIDHDPTEQ